MTMTNVIAGFHTTGIFLFSRNALLPVSGSETPSKFNLKSLCEGTKLKFILVYSPATPAQSMSIPSIPSSIAPFYMISVKKKLLFSQRDIAKGTYNLTHDPCYNFWVLLKTDEGAVKDLVSSEPVIIEESNLQKGAMASKDISKESRVDSTIMNRVREEPVQLKHTTAL